MTVLEDAARAKLNLCLFVGPRIGDGRHELVTVMDSLTLADEVRLTVAADGLEDDEIVCPGVEADNLAAAALAAFRRRTGWEGPPVRVEITKRIPVAGGMAGGSADAAAVLRLAAAAAGIDDDWLLEQIAAELGSDVPSQVRGGLVLATGVGSRLRPLAPMEPYTAVVLPVDARLSTADVYAEADRLGLPRDVLGLARSLTRIQAALSSETLLEHVHNDLQDAARSLCPQIDEALAAAERAGADRAIVSGSGPTVVGLYFGSEHERRSAAGAAELAADGRTPAPIVAAPA
jgi:4-diphosphocytidyl-2-C-methyl-D-erythritol kinase